MSDHEPTPADHIQRTRIVLGVAAAIHVLFTPSLPRAWTVTMAMPLPGGTMDSSVTTARLIGLGLSTLWLLGGIAWIALDIWGLGARRPWALTSTRIYLVLSLFTICCLPFGGLGLYWLSRPGVREAFRAGGTG